MSSDKQFTATGPTAIGFQTHGARIDRGADVAGNSFGARGASVDGAGVIGESRNRPGVEGSGQTGVMGHGNSGPGVEGIGASAEAGVVGRGGAAPHDDRMRDYRGMGVFGIAGTQPDPGVVDGAGVCGVGSNAEHQRVPGVGVVGRGGGLGNLGDADAGAAFRHAPGVVGYAGGRFYAHAHQPGLVGDVGVVGLGGAGVAGHAKATAGVGVIGYGAGGEERPHLFDVPGAGVKGIGGQRFSEEMRLLEAGAGVVGISRGPDVNPSFPDVFDTGVCGIGETGVRGIGVHGRGGVFESESGAQVCLQPGVSSDPLPDESAYTPTAVPTPGVNGPLLPLDGQAGDLMSVVDGQGSACTLWFCVRPPQGANPAQWAQVLLGPVFDGRRP